MNLEQYYLELSIFVASVISGLALKDWSVSFIKGLNFKMNPQFKEGDKVKLDGEEAVVIKIGMTTSVFGVTAKDGYTWRYVANDKIPNLKLEKIINKDLHLDSDIERGLRMQELIDKAQDSKIGRNRDNIERNAEEIESLKRGRK